MHRVLPDALGSIEAAIESTINKVHMGSWNIISWIGRERGTVGKGREAIPLFLKVSVGARSLGSTRSLLKDDKY